MSYDKKMRAIKNATPREGVDMHVRTEEELGKLEEPGTEYVRVIGLVSDERAYEEIPASEFEVTPENFADFLPVYTEENPPHLNILALQNEGKLLGPDGKLLPSAQEEYDQESPQPQDSFVDEVGV